MQKLMQNVIVDEAVEITYIENDLEEIWNLLQCCYTSIQCYILSNNGTSQDVEDVIHDVYIYLTTEKKIKDFKSFKYHASGYILSCVRNIWQRELLYRERNVLCKAQECFYLPDDGIEDEMLLQQRRVNLFRKHFVWMSHECRKILKYSFMKIPARIAAEKLGYSEEAYKKRKLRHLISLTKKIKNDPVYKDLASNESR